MFLIQADLFFEIIINFELVPCTQTRGMYRYLALGGKERIKFFVNDIDHPTIACFGHEKRFLHRKMISIEGECYTKQTISNYSEDIRNFYEQLTHMGYDFIEVCSNAQFNFNYEIAMRQAGFLRPVGQFSMPVTKIIDLTKEITYSKNWKQNIKKSLRFNLIFETPDIISESECADFVLIYNEMISRKSLSKPLTVSQVYALCENRDFAIYFVSHNGKRIAATIIHERQSYSGSYYAATGNEALRLSASFFLYFSMLNHLKQKKYISFDMEKLVPSTKAINSVFLFKNGIEGTYQSLNGEWAWYKKNYYRPLMYFVKKYLMKKREL